jgi:hypothetical protein
MMAREKSLLVKCPQFEEGGKGKYKHRQNASNCPSLKAAIEAALKRRP